MIKLSIIIPVYNVEHYIRKCLESCLKQNLSNEEYEIIVVNDGTLDASIELVHEVQKGATNIRIINRENGGLSAARNTGLKEAIGEYVWFIDSDDWIEPYVLKKLLDRAYNDKLDVLCFNLQLAFQDGRTNKRHVVFEKYGKVYKGSSFIGTVRMPPAAWAAIYRRVFLVQNNLFFYEGIIHEDQEFTPRAYYKAERIAYVDDIVYNYNQREGGIMKSKQNVKRCKDLLTVADSLYSFACQYVGIDTPAYSVFMEKIAFAFSQSLANYDPKAFPLKVYLEKEYYPLYISQSMNCKEKWKYRLANLSLRNYLFLYRILKQ